MAILARGAKENGRQLPLGVLRAEGATEQDEETGKDQPPDAEGPDEMADAEDVEDEGARLNQPRLRYPAKASESLFSSSRVLGVPLWRITLLNLVCWFTASFSYYGLALNSGNLHGSVYLNAAVNSLIDVPALFLAIPLFDKLGRARTLTVTLLIGALACCTFCLLPAPCEVAGGETCEGVADWGAIRTGTAFTGKFMLAIVFGCVFLYTTEVFPTSMRAEGMGLCSVAARVGGVAAPLVVLLDAYSKELPMWIFGGVAFVAGVVSAWLPETLGKELASGIGG